MVSSNVLFYLILDTLNENTGKYLSAEQIQIELITGHGILSSTRQISQIIYEKAKPGEISVKERSNSKGKNLYRTPYVKLSR